MPPATTVDRLTAVKQVLDDFLARRKGDRVGVVVFGDAAFALVPFTTDLDSLPPAGAGDGRSAWRVRAPPSAMRSASASRCSTSIDRDGQDHHRADRRQRHGEQGAAGRGGARRQGQGHRHPHGRGRRSRRGRRGQARRGGAEGRRRRHRRRLLSRARPRAARRHLPAARRDRGAQDRHRDASGRAPSCSGCRCGARACLSMLAQALMVVRLPRAVRRASA